MYSSGNIVHICRKRQNMRIIVSCILLQFIICSILAQNIKGKVYNQADLPVENVAVIMQDQDSTFVDAACTDSLGVFNLKTAPGSFRLIVQHLMYETYEGSYTTWDDITIRLIDKENSLGEVIVKGERPVFKLADGKITYDMPRLLQGKVISNAYESLLQLPGVSEQGDILALAGSTGVTVLINGQTTSMPLPNLIAALKSIPYDQVQSAEIMYSTPPQYHIRGAAINITLKGGKSGEGIQGQINTIYSQSHYANSAVGASLLYATPKFTADLNYSYNLNHTKTGLDLYSHHFYQGTVNEIEQFSRGNAKTNDHNIRLGLAYQLSGENKLGLTYTSQLVTGVDKNEYSSGTFPRSGNHKEDIKPIQLHNILVNYTSGFGLKTGMEYTGYNDHTSQHFVESSAKGTNFIADSRQRINRYRVFADQSHSAGTWKLNYGAQYIYAKDHSSQNYHFLNGQDLPASDIDSKLKEYTGNLYAGFEKSFGDKLSLSASLTGEYYKLADFSEWSVFPALETTYSVSPSHMLQLSFSSDKVYPSYWEIHGGVSYLSGYNELHGNPRLRPYKEYSAQLNYFLKSKYILTAYYIYMKDYSAQMPYQLPDRLTLIYQTLNFDYRQMTGLNLIVPFGIGRLLDSRLTLNGFYDKVKSSHFHDTSFSKDNLVFYAGLDNTFSLSTRPNLKLEISGSYITKNIQGPAELSAVWNLDAGIKWSFWQDKAELRVKGTDLFNSGTPDMTLKYGTQNLKMKMVPDSRAVIVSFSFRLGDFKPSDKKVDVSRFGTK